MAPNKPSQIRVYADQAEALLTSLRGWRRLNTKARPKGVTCRDWIDTDPDIATLTYRGIPITVAPVPSPGHREAA